MKLFLVKRLESDYNEDEFCNGNLDLIVMGVFSSKPLAEAFVKSYTEEWGNFYKPEICEFELDTQYPHGVM